MTILNFKMILLIAIICFILSIFRIAYGEYTSKNIPKVLRYVYVCIHIILFGCCIATPITGYNVKNQDIYLIIILLIEVFSFSICISSSLNLNEMEKWKEKQKKLSGYKKITGKTLSKYLGMEYIPKICNEKEIDDTEVFCKLNETMLMEFIPLNGIQISKTYSWEKEDIFISNFDSFRGIKNLVEVLVEITSLYKMSIENNIFINPFSFGLKLIPAEEKNMYIAKLVLQEETVLNKMVEPYEREKYQKKLLNEFLFYFIGYNFGVQMRDPRLKNEINELIKVAKQKGIFEKRNERNSCINNYYVQHFEFL